MAFIDIHSHILPCVDDGAQSLQEALELLKQEKEQGIDAVICTPHFYPEFSTLEEHLSTATTAFENFKKTVSQYDLPEIFLGHEVQCYPQIARSTGLEMCTLNGSNCLLLELPFTHSIPKGTLNEISRLTDELGFKVIIAHIERYFADKEYKTLLSLIKNNTVSAQINADSFLDPVLKRPIKKLLKQNLVSFVASDAHSLKERPVKIREFLKFILLNYPTAYRKIIFDTDNLYEELKENNCIC